MAIHDDDLPMRYNLFAHEEFDGLKDLLVQFYNRPGAKFKNVAQQHLALPEPQ